MKKELTKKEELSDFLARHCEIKYSVADTAAIKHKIYIFHTRDCVLFMAEAYIQGMRNAIGQNEEMMIDARKRNDFSEVIMIYNWSAPDPGMDLVQIPEALVSKLTKDQAAVFLRNLERIQKDIDEGKALKEALHKLFGGKAVISTAHALDGERQFYITGTISAGDKRGYAERYAEKVATDVLFDLPKALNAGLQIFLPEFARGALFIEGRKNFYKKVRYGSDETHTELLLTAEGAAALLNATKESVKTHAEISRILQQSITDPFGMSLKYYLGKHPLIKLPTKDGEK